MPPQASGGSSSTPMSAANGVVGMLEKPILSIYTTSTPIHELDSVFTQLYAQDATFEDPLVIVQGRDSIRSQFLSLRQVFFSSRVIRHELSFDQHKLLLQCDLVRTSRAGCTFAIPSLF